MTITDRIDAITKIPHEYRAAYIPAPRSVKIEITGRCNFRCGFCALRTRKEQPKGDMDFRLFQKITRQMREAGVEEIGAFYLGESTMAPELLVDAVSWCKKELAFPYVFLTTNGSQCTPEIVAMLMESGLDSLKFSVNACSSHQFIKVMGVASKLWRASLLHIREARRIRDEGEYKCGLYASSIQYDGEQLEQMKAMLAEHVLPFVDQHYWLPLYSMGSLATKREEELGYTPTAGNQGRIGALRDPLPCWSAFTEGHVTADGILSACCFDADGRWHMGDLREQSFMEAWNSEKFQQLRLAHLRKDVWNTPCRECVAYA
jgi:radical SAM protein with 4Fe4S-binding SPASM domain